MGLKDHFKKRANTTPADIDDKIDLPSGVTLVRTFEGHAGIIRGLAFDRQGETLATGSADRSVRPWSVQSGNLLRTLEKGQRTIWSVACAPQGNVLASTSSDNTIKLWDVGSGQLLNSLKGHKESCFAWFSTREAKCWPALATMTQ